MAAPATITTEQLLRLETEDEFQAWVIDYARAHGWRRAHFRPARTEKGWRTPVSADGKGFPDLVLARQGVVYIVELKSETGRIDAAQVAWGNELGGVYRLWRPRDRAEIERLLSSQPYGRSSLPLHPPEALT